MRLASWKYVRVVNVQITKFTNFYILIFELCLFNRILQCK